MSNIAKRIEILTGLQNEASEVQKTSRCTAEVAVITVLVQNLAFLAAEVLELTERVDRLEHPLYTAYHTPSKS